jgi:hypothetical protein
VRVVHLKTPGVDSPPMTYWNMQLHPATPDKALLCTVQSLSSSLVGLDFPQADVGDLSRPDCDRAMLRRADRVCIRFATEMSDGDRVLVFVHNFPFALCRVAGPYTYVQEPVLGLWRHFRKVDDLRFLWDHIKNPHAWPRIPMAWPLVPLRQMHTASYQIIEDWLGEAGV